MAVYLGYHRVGIIKVIDPSIKANLKTLYGTYMFLAENAKNAEIDNLTIKGNSVQKILPDEYQAVEYIESSGTQYIDTGFAPNQDTRVIVDFQLTKLTSAFICGARENASSKAYTLNMGMVNGKCQLRSIYNSQTHMLSADFKTERCVIDKNGAVVYMDNEYKVTHWSAEFTAPGSLYIFACNQANTAGGYLPDEMRLYSFKMYDSGILIRNYVPCYRKTDSAAGLYDVVNNKFYANAGTGTFGVGADVVPTTNTPIEIRSVGDKTKNLFDVSNESGWELGTYYSYSIFVGANETVTVSWDNDLTLGQGFYLVFGYQSSHKGTANGTWLYHSTSESICKSSINVTADADGYIYINMSPRRLDKIKNLQIEYGETPTEFEEYGYKIPIKIYGANVENENTINIYLKEPLRKVGESADVLDYKTKKVLRNVEVLDDSGTKTIEESYQGLATSIEETIEIPTITLNAGTNNIIIETSIEPSSAELKYWEVANG